MSSLHFTQLPFPQDRLHFQKLKHRKTINWSKILCIGSGQGGVNLTFPVAAPTALCCVSVASKVLITHRCCGCCWAVLAPHQGCLPNIPTPPPVGWGWARSWEGTQPGQLTQTPEKGYSMPYDICSAIKAERKEEKGGQFIYNVCLPESPLHVLKRCWTSPADGK